MKTCGKCKNIDDYASAVAACENFSLKTYKKSSPDRRRATKREKSIKRVLSSVFRKFLIGISISTTLGGA